MTLCTAIEVIVVEREEREREALNVLSKIKLVDSSCRPGDMNALYHVRVNNQKTCYILPARSYYTATRLNRTHGAKGSLVQSIRN